MTAKQRRLEQLRGRIPQIGTREAFDLQRAGAALIDMREPDEVVAGSPKGAIRLPRGFLELRIEEHVADLEHTLLVLCQVGERSLFAAEDLLHLGYKDVRSVTGGFRDWKAQNLPIVIPRTLDSDARERYSRHLLIPEVGEQGQLKLLGSSVLLVGAGGLGSPAALYLAAAGVGTLGIIDDDLVERSNLQRQILHTESSIGTPKVSSAKQALEALNPSTQVRTFQERLGADNVDALLRGYDVVVDGSDNFNTRYLVNDTCVKLGIPNVHGSVFRFEGQVSVFWPGRSGQPGPCYRCLFPEPPPPELAPSCAEAGVLGVLPGVIGLLEAVETLKVLLGIGEPLVGRMLTYDALSARFSELEIDADPHCVCCGDGENNGAFTEYQTACRLCTA